MPTGYTAILQEKDDIPFRDFALRCARAFGALVEMRDESLEAKIPDKIIPSSYHQERLRAAKKELSEAQSMTKEKAKTLVEKDYDAALQSYVQSLSETSKIARNYVQMREQVKKWVPPTPDHVGLKNFMLSQLEESIEHDCSVKYHELPKKSSPKEYKAERIRAAQRDIAYHTKEGAAEIKRADGRTEWIQQLMKSLSPNK